MSTPTAPPNGYESKEKRQLAREAEQDLKTLPPEKLSPFAKAFLEALVEWNPQVDEPYTPLEAVEPVEPVEPAAA